MVVGLGAIGCEVVARALRHPELRLVAVVDPAHEGVRLDTLVPGAPPLVVAAEPRAAYRLAKGGTALLCTGSILEEHAPQVEQALAAGLHVVSSCEELAHAAFVDEELAGRLDRAARKAGVAVLGTGVNPGFVLDRLVATAASSCGDIRHVEAGRIVDVAKRRPALQHKAGVGLTVAEFERLAEEGEIGHVGLTISCALLAEGLALTVDEIEEEIDPVIATSAFAGAVVPIAAGRVRGIRQIARAFDEGREVVRIVLELSAGAEDPRDWATIDADPPMRLLIPGGTPGEAATAWALCNAAVRVAAAEPGLLTVMDLPAGR